LFGAQLAARLGLPYAFASHFAPGQMSEAIELYRRQFRPSKQQPTPYVLLGINVFAADSEEEAQRLFTSLQQAFVNLRRGRPGKLPPPIEGYDRALGLEDRALLEHALRCSIVGTRETVHAGLRAFAARHGADELMVTGMIFDHAARLRSFEIGAEALR
ncbi:MAG: LLM class flavin-dependent oxidoreductase, partial [Minicystis sp.]